MVIGQIRGMLEHVLAVTSVTSDVAKRSDEERQRSSTGTADARQRASKEEEMPTTEDRILDLVDRNGGRIEQSEIVSHLQYSAATVSRRLGDMEEDGDVVRYKVGRKKVVCLPDRTEIHESPDVGSEEEESDPSEKPRISA